MDKKRNSAALDRRNSGKQEKHSQEEQNQIEEAEVEERYMYSKKRKAIWWNNKL